MINLYRPTSHDQPPLPGERVKIFFSPAELGEIAEVGSHDGMQSLDQLVGTAVREYIQNRKQSPTFPDELRAARERAAMVRLVQEHPYHLSAPTDRTE